MILHHHHTNFIIVNIFFSAIRNIHIFVCHAIDSLCIMGNQRTMECTILFCTYLQSPLTDIPHSTYCHQIVLVNFTVKNYAWSFLKLYLLKPSCWWEKHFWWICETFLYIHDFCRHTNMANIQAILKDKLVLWKKFRG